jgi:hypothetical protein
MALLTVVDISRAGVVADGAAAAGGGDKFANTGKELLLVKNGSGAPITVTLVTASTSDPEGLAITDKTVVVGAGVTTAIGPFPQGIYNDADGNVNFSYSGVTSLTVKALRLTAE